MSDIDRDWELNGQWTHQPEDETRFACACGDEHCIGYDDDPANLNINGAWYAAECQMGQQLDRIAAGRNAALRADEQRDDPRRI